MSTASGCSIPRHCSAPSPSPSPRHHPTPLPSRSNSLLPETQHSIGPYLEIKGGKSPCPALNALCNHGAYGMPRDGKDVHASVLANALVHVYGLKPYFAKLLAYGTIWGITQNTSFTIDLDRLCDAPIAHFAPLVHRNPSNGHHVCGTPSRFLYNQMEECGHKHRPNDFNLEDFALWRLKREKDVEDEMPRVQKYIAAGELALLLQVFGDKHNDYSIPRHDLRNFLSREQLPNDWTSRRALQTNSVGFASTFHVGHLVRKRMAALSSRMYIPYYIWLTVALWAALGVAWIAGVTLRRKL